MSDISTRIYEGSASLGRFQANVGMVIGVIFALLLLACGVYLITNNDDNKYIAVNGKVTKADCKSHIVTDSKGKRRQNYSCNLTIEYTIDKVYSGSLFVDSGTNYKVGDNVSLWVDKSDYSKIKMSEIKKTWLGAGAIGCAILIVGFSALNLYMVRNYELAASAQGARTAYDIVT